jgi:hypothetical protein
MKKQLLPTRINPMACGWREQFLKNDVRCALWVVRKTGQ